MQAEFEIESEPNVTAPRGPTQRITGMDINQLWDQLLTERQDNGDVIVPASLVPIM